MNEIELSGIRSIKKEKLFGVNIKFYVYEEAIYRVKNIVVNPNSVDIKSTIDEAKSIAIRTANNTDNIFKFYNCNFPNKKISNYIKNIEVAIVLLKNDKSLNSFQYFKSNKKLIVLTGNKDIRYNMIAILNDIIYSSFREEFSNFAKKYKLKINNDMIKLKGKYYNTDIKNNGKSNDLLKIYDIACKYFSEFVFGNLLFGISNNKLNSTEKFYYKKIDGYYRSLRDKSFENLLSIMGDNINYISDFFDKV